MMTINSFRGRLIIAFIVLALLPLGITTFVINTHTVSTLETLSLESLQQTSMLVSADTSSFIRERENELKLLASVNSLTQLNSEQQKTLLSSLLLFENNYERLELLDGSGTAPVELSRSSVTERSVENLINEDIFMEVSQSGETFFGPVYFDDTLLEPLITIALPLFDPRSGDVTSVLAAELRFVTVWKLLDTIETPESTDVYIVDASGRIIAHKNPSIVLKATMIDIPAADGRATGLMGDDVVVAVDDFFLGHQQFFVISEQPTSTALALASDSLSTAIIVAGLAMLAVLVTSIVMVRPFSGPLDAISRMASKIAQGEWSTRVEPIGQIEFKQLAIAINQMADAIQSREQQLTSVNQSLEQLIVQLKDEIQQRKETESQLRLFHHLVNHAADMIFLVDPETSQFLDVNKAACRTLGYTRDELLNLRFLDIQDILPTVDSWRQQVDQVKQSLVHVEEFYTQKTGETFPIESNLTFVTYTDRHYIVIAARDISIRKQAESNALALTLEQERSGVLQRFISDVSHDLRTPLTAMRGSLYILEHSTDVAKRKRHLEILTSQTDRLQQLFEGMLNMVRLDTLVELDLELTDLNDLVRSIVVELDSKAGQENQDLRFIAAQDIPRLLVDVSRLTHAITNLVENALQYTPAAGTITLQTWQQNNYVVLEVHDTGIGIDKHDLPYIFDRFFRADEARNTSTGGVGLGLAIVRRVAEMHRGFVEVESEVGVGSVFRLYLPLDA